MMSFRCYPNQVKRSWFDAKCGDDSHWAALWVYQGVIQGTWEIIRAASWSGVSLLVQWEYLAWMHLPKCNCLHVNEWCCHWACPGLCLHSTNRYIDNVLVGGLEMWKHHTGIRETGQLLLIFHSPDDICSYCQYNQLSAIINYSLLFCHTHPENLDVCFSHKCLFLHVFQNKPINICL